MNPSRSSGVSSKKLPQTPAVEYILVVEDEEASQLTDELRLICDHLDDDIKTEKELDELREAFIRLARVVSESRPGSFNCHEDVG